MMKQLKMMFLTQWRMSFRELQAWFWGIFFPVILMVIFMVIFSGGSEDDFQVKVAVVSEQPTEAAVIMLEQIKHIPVLELTEDSPASREEAEALVIDGEVAAAILLPDAEDGDELTLIVNKEKETNAAAMTVRGILSQVVQQTNLIVSGAAPAYGLKIESVSAGSDDLKAQDFIMTGMIALAIAQSGLFGMVDMVEMRRRGLLKRLRMTPAKMGLFGFSDMIMRLVFAVIQIVLLSLIGVYIFGASLHIDLISLLVIFLVGVLSFNAMGYFFSSISKTSEAYMAMANILNFLMMFLSGIFFAVETMPSWLQPLSNILPLTYFVNGIRDSMVYNTGILTGSFWFSIGVITLWGAAAFILGSLFYRSRSITTR